MKRLIFLISIILLSSVSVDAQRNRKKASKNKKEKTEEVVEDPRITIMKNSVQQIMFIDSIVVDKNEFFKHYRLSPEMGSMHSSKEFWGNNSQHNTYIFLNELKDKCYFQIKKDTTSTLYASDMYGDEWSEPYELKGIADTAKYININYPYMMPDGVTFYFAATGKESIGGYDIFVTRYDSDEGKFLHAENIGMPFNSTANDYLYAIDDYNNLGWFATDRNQKKDKVCIYIFIPSESRKIYNSNKLSAEKIEQLARINRISDTWSDKQKRKEALERLNESIEMSDSKDKTNGIYFVVNDKTVYTSENEFKSPKSKEKFTELKNLYSKYDTIEKTLNITRNYYSKANDKDKEELKPSILKNENEYYSIEKTIKILEKEIRNLENSFVK